MVIVKLFVVWLLTTKNLPNKEIWGYKTYVASSPLSPLLPSFMSTKVTRALLGVQPELSIWIDLYDYWKPDQFSKDCFDRLQLAFSEYVSCLLIDSELQSPPPPPPPFLILNKQYTY